MRSLRNWNHPQWGWSRALSALLPAVLAVASLQDISPLAEAQESANRTQADTKQITDQGITRAIETRLRRASGLDSERIEVTTMQGHVILSGTVPMLDAKNRAQTIAEGIRGVNSAENHIKVRPAERPDEQIRADVRAALEASTATDEAAKDIEVQVAGGVVTLTGTVGNHAMTRVIAETVDEVRGIKEIRNQLKVGDQPRLTDDEIAGMITRRFRADAGLRGSDIQVEVRGDKVILSGTVGSAAARSWAIRDAWVTGVTEVAASGLKVRWRDREGSARPATRADSW
ncbi:MAG TPA: BON domain-containing protein, partial [Isosphaeraceae bacterium]